MASLRDLPEEQTKNLRLVLNRPDQLFFLQNGSIRGVYVLARAGLVWLFCG